MDAQDLLEDNITLKNVNSNKQKKACIKLNYNQNKIDRLITLQITLVNGSTCIWDKRRRRQKKYL